MSEIVDPAAGDEPQHQPDETYPFAAACEFCHEAIWDHSPSELKSCAADIDARQEEADALAWWRSQQ